MSSPTSDSTVQHRSVVTFPPTPWTLVLEAARGDEEKLRQALGRLCVLYREPIRSWLRRTGVPPNAVEDLTQQFIEHLLEGNRLKNVERRETKFRTFLIECLKRFVRGEWRKEMAVKRGGGTQRDYLDEATLGLMPELEKVLDLEFARAVHLQALNRLGSARLEHEARRARFLELRRFIWGHDPDVSYAEVGVRLGMSPNHVKKAVFDLRQDYYDAFRAEVSRTVVPALVDEETRYLMTLAAGAEGDILRPEDNS